MCESDHEDEANGWNGYDDVIVGGNGQIREEDSPEGLQSPVC